MIFKKTKITFFFTIIILVLIFTFSSTINAAQSNTKIALIMGGISHDVNVLWYNGAVKGLKELGVEYVVYNAENDRARTINYIEDAIRQQVDAILLANVFTDSVEPIVNKAKEAGIITVSIDAGIPSATIEVTSDNRKLGRDIAEELAKEINSEGNIVIFYTPGYKPIDIRREVLGEVLKENPKINIIAELGYAWPGTVQDTRAKMESLLNKYPEKGSIDAIWGCFDLCTVGAILAAKEADRNILGFGIDGDKMALEMIAGDTPFAATVLQDPFQMGEKAAYLAYDYLQGKDVPKTYYVPAKLVTKENVGEELKNLENRLK